MSSDEAAFTPPARPAMCPHDVRGPLRQACCCCGACDHLDFRVTNEAWTAVVPADLDGGHVCLRCFDALAAERGVNYAKALTVMCFVGDAAVLTFAPISAVSVVELRTQATAAVTDE
jgi:hypothetical protein